jgi:hypothetical protein
MNVAGRLQVLRIPGIENSMGWMPLLYIATTELQQATSPSNSSLMCIPILLGVAAAFYLRNIDQQLAAMSRPLDFSHYSLTLELLSVCCPTCAPCTLRPLSTTHNST